MPDLHWEGYNFPAYRDPTQPWLLMSYESANSIRQRSHSKGKFPVFTGAELKGVINRTISLRTDSDVVVRHGYIEKREQPLTQSELAQAYSQEESPADLPGAPVAWFVSHCKDFAGRLKYVHWLQRFIGVDIYGECGPLQCGASRNMGQEYSLKSDPCFHLVNRKYKFYLSFENAICKDYVTEKIFNALRQNTIPVVLGGTNYTSILPPNSVINAGSFSSPEGLAKYLHQVLANTTLFDSYFHWRPFYNIHSFTSVPDNCALCDKLTSGQLSSPHTYSDMFSWLVRGAGCVFTKPDWGLKQYKKVWSIAGKRS